MKHRIMLVLFWILIVATTSHTYDARASTTSPIASYSANVEANTGDIIIISSGDIIIISSGQVTTFNNGEIVVNTPTEIIIISSGQVTTNENGDIIIISSGQITILPVDQ